jgi:hypothetical protein
LSVLIQLQQPFNTHPFEIIPKSGRLAAILGEIRGERFGTVFLGGGGCGLDIHPQVVIVLHVKAAAVERVSAVRRTDDGIGCGDGGRPRVRADFFIGDHSLDLDNRTVCRAVQEQVEPPRPAKVLHVPVRVGRSGMESAVLRSEVPLVTGRGKL